MGNEMSDVRLCKECKKPATVLQIFDSSCFTFASISKYNSEYDMKVWTIYTCEDHIVDDNTVKNQCKKCKCLKIVKRTADNPFRKYYLL